MVANPDITPFWGNFRLGGYPPRTMRWPRKRSKADISVLLAQDSELQTKRRAAYPSISSTFLRNAFTLSWDYLLLAGLAGSGP